MTVGIWKPPGSVGRGLPLSSVGTEMISVAEGDTELTEGNTRVGELFDLSIAEAMDAALVVLSVALVSVFVRSAAGDGAAGRLLVA